MRIDGDDAKKSIDDGIKSNCNVNVTKEKWTKRYLATGRYRPKGL